MHFCVGSDGMVAFLHPSPSPYAASNQVCYLVLGPSGKLKGQFSPVKYRFQAGLIRDWGAFGLHI